MKKVFNDIFLLIILFVGDILINDHNYFFLLIYGFISVYNLYIYFVLCKNNGILNADSKNFLILSIFLYLFTYFIICDPNPFFYFLSFYSFFPDFVRGIFVVLLHSYFISYYTSNNYRLSINLKNSEELPLKFNSRNKRIIKSYFLSFFFNFMIKKTKCKYLYIGLSLLILFLKIIIFLNRIKIWVYFNKKEKTLPVATFRNTTFYITSNIANIQNIIGNYINQLKNLIEYLGKNNVIISIVENGDSKDDTGIILKDFQNYLTEKKILNKFYLDRVIEDPRKIRKPFEKYSRLRIEYFANLRNKCLEFLYELPNIDFDNTIIIFLNDIVFSFEDIINLLSTNEEDFDVACGLDMINNTFHDRWVSIDFEGEGLIKFFPFFMNKEAQDLLIDHKPIRVFSCWNGVIAFRASPIKNKKVQFRYKSNYTMPKYRLNNLAKDYYESECTFFNIDFFSLGYNKKFINPDVIVTYEHKTYFESKYHIPSLKNILGYFVLYFVGLSKKRNKYMSNYKNITIKLNIFLYNWYLEYKK